MKESGMADFLLADLLADPTLELRLLGGDQGLDRSVLWAHSCEKLDPWRWLGPHELLMTIGLCIPRAAEAQRELLVRLHKAGVAGMIIGDDGMAPRLTKGFFEQAEALGFAVLAAGEHTPFAAVGRTVAAANAEAQTMNVLKLSRLYQLLSAADADELRSGTPYRDVLGLGVVVRDVESGAILIGTEEERDSVVSSEPDPRTFPLRTIRETSLSLTSASSVDGLLLVHLMQILGVEANKILQTVEDRRTRKMREFMSILIGENGVRADSVFTARIERATYRLLSGAADEAEKVSFVLGLEGLDSVCVRHADQMLVLVPDQELQVMRELLSALDVRVGVSAAHRGADEIEAARYEARAEFEVLLVSGGEWREYRGVPLGVLLRTKQEAKQIVESVLGDLTGGGRRERELQATLFVLLDHDLKRSEAAEALGIHRQSLVYRIKQIEAITGRSLNRVGDVSEIWLARSAWELLN